jgi:hypothetical protein
MIKVAKPIVALGAVALLLAGCAPGDELTRGERQMLGAGAGAAAGAAIVGGGTGSLLAGAAVGGALGAIAGGRMGSN